MRTMLKSHRSLTARSCNGQSDGTKRSSMPASTWAASRSPSGRTRSGSTASVVIHWPLAAGHGRERGGLELVGEHCRHPHPRQPAELDPVHP